MLTTTRTMWIWLFLLGLGHYGPVRLRQVQCADPVFTPATVTDVHGNVADNNSMINWAPLPQTQKYAGPSEYDDGGLSLYFNFARSFINTVQPKDLPYDLILGLIKGDYSITDKIMDLVMYALGFIICFAIGLIFCGIMPLVGLIFCCCRCCGKCGGRMQQRYDEKRNCKRIVFAVILSILTIFITVGMACTYVINNRMNVALDNFKDSSKDNLNDIVLFMDNTLEEVKHVAVEDFKFTTSVMTRDLDNIGYLVGIPIRDELAGSGGVDNAIDAIINLETSVNTVGDALYAVNISIATLKDSGQTLKDDLAGVATDIDNAQLLVGCAASCLAIDSSQIALDIDFSSLPDISNEVSLMEDVRSKDLSNKALEGKQQFDDIPDRVINETQTMVTDIKNMLNSFDSTISKHLEALDVLNGTSGQVEDITDFTEDATDTLEFLNRFRWMGGLALFCVILLIVLLQFLGLFCGLCGYDKDALPTERSCLSHTGGNFLMAASGFIFLLSAVLMMVTSISFLIGGNLEKAVCQPLTDPDYTVFKEIMDTPGGLFDDYFLGKMFFGNGSIPLTISGVLEGCRQNQAAYTVLKLDALFNVDEVVDYKSAINIDQELDNLNVDLSTVQILSADTEQQLRDFGNSVQLNFTGFRDELQKNTTKTNLTDLAATIRGIANDGTNTDPAKASLLQAANDLDTINTGSYSTVFTNQEALLNSADALETSVSTIPTTVNNTIDTALAVQTYLQTNGSDLVKVEAKKYADRVLAIADSFVSNTVDAVKNHIGKCKPIWNLWDSMIDVALCKYTVDSLNGFWFSLGWCVFFMVPSVIFNIKLAKHFRRMKYVESFEDFESYAGDLPMKNSDSKPNSKLFTKNKVGHDDSAW